MEANGLHRCVSTLARVSWDGKIKTALLVFSSVSCSALCACCVREVRYCSVFDLFPESSGERSRGGRGTQDYPWYAFTCVFTEYFICPFRF